MSTTNTKTITMFVTAMAVLLGATMIANPIALVNAQGNQSQGNKTNATGGAKAVTITKIDVDPIMKALKDAYPKAGDIKDDKVDAVKDLKDAKETAKTMVAANLLRDLTQFKALQDMK
jgi:Holliday junction resolvase RusA-like endonuclease